MWDNLYSQNWHKCLSKCQEELQGYNQEVINTALECQQESQSFDYVIIILALFVYIPGIFGVTNKSLYSCLDDKNIQDQYKDLLDICQNYSEFYNSSYCKFIKQNGNGYEQEWSETFENNWKNCLQICSGIIDDINENSSSDEQYARYKESQQNQNLEVDDIENYNDGEQGEGEEIYDGEFDGEVFIEEDEDDDEDNDEDGTEDEDFQIIYNCIYRAIKCSGQQLQYFALASILLIVFLVL
ncbi:hypothetical protein PPERSA_08045 [Pseudocohnilembus persalinus]|uniref:Transmembrane protein n=1 Tax=Pseudocohnilembus persalinus TaxID=266149 RepID=A0A0V0R2H0_PSEPJ|nr:hypothetical protein PPERSA_08045 [Pseudocohnilembus persalinus]|eukprot:KRX08734.1 hypothetical protein PPERSA_08045 [Pseudocohnilembus persalinus]